MKLTEAQLAQFQNDGFIILRDFADPAQCEAILDVAKVHLKHRIEPIETETGYDIKSKEYRTDVADYTSMPTELCEDSDKFIVEISSLKNGWRMRRSVLF